MTELRADHEHFKKVLKEAEELRWKKLQMYGICYDDYGLLGVATKINDKNSRLRNIVEQRLLPKEEMASIMGDETLRDTAIDLLNYAAMFVMVLDKIKEK